MFRNIVLPVEVAKVEHYEKMLTIACDLSRLYNAPIIVIALPASDAPCIPEGAEALRDVLKAFVSEQTAGRGVSMTAKTIPSGSSPGDLGEALAAQIAETGADLVLIPSDGPDDGFLEAAQQLVARSNASVFLVR